MSWQTDSRPNHIYILWKSLFHWIYSKFYKFKHGHEFFLTSDLMKAVRGQKHLSEAKKGMEELINWKKKLVKVSQQPQKPLSGSNQIWTMTSDKKDTATIEVAAAATAATIIRVEVAVLQITLLLLLIIIAHFIISKDTHDKMPSKWCKKNPAFLGRTSF